MTNFTSINEALQFKTHCPFCKKTLKKDIVSYYSSDSTTALTSWLDENIHLKISLLSPENTVIDVIINSKMNTFNYGCIDNSDTNIGWVLNNLFLTIHNECIECRYTISFNSLKFDLPSRKIHKMRLDAVQWHLGDYKVYSEYENGNTQIYYIAENSYDFVANVPCCYNLTEGSASGAEAWLKNIITFS